MLYDHIAIFVSVYFPYLYYALYIYILFFDCAIVVITVYLCAKQWKNLTSRLRYDWWKPKNFRSFTCNSSRNVKFSHNNVLPIMNILKMHSLKVNAFNSIMTKTVWLKLYIYIFFICVQYFLHSFRFESEKEKDSKVRISDL